MSLAKHDQDRELQRELALHRYIEAFENADFDELEAVLTLAQEDAELDRRIAGVNGAFHDEAGLQPIEDQAVQVRRLLHRYLPSGVPSVEEIQPVTVGQVAAALEGNVATASKLPAADRMANRRLLTSDTPVQLPATRTTVMDLAQRLAVQATDRYWETFRRTAVQLGLARQRQNVELRAAREQFARRKRSASRGRGTGGKP